MNQVEKRNARQVRPDGTSTSGTSPKPADNVDTVQSALIDVCPDSIFSMDRNGIVLEANTACAARFGLAVDELIGQSIFDFMPPDVAAERRAGWLQLEEAKQPITYLDGRDGQWFESQVVPNFDAQGILIGAAVFARDVTDRVGAEMTIRENEARQAQAQKISRLGYFERNLATGKSYWSEEYFHIYGVTPDQMPSYASFLDLIHPEDRERVQQNVERATTRREPFEHEYRVQRPDGTIAYVTAAGEIVVGPDGKAEKVMGTVRDITVQAAAREALRDSHDALEEKVAERTQALQAEVEQRKFAEERLARAVAGTNDALWEWNVQDDELHLAPRWFEMLGYKEETLECKRDTLLALIHPDDLERFTDNNRAHFEDGAPYDIEIRLRRGDDRYLWVRSRAQLVRDNLGAPLYLAGSLTDIDERKKAEARAESLERRFLDAIEAMAESVYLYDANGQFVMGNSKMKEEFAAFSELLVPGTTTPEIVQAIWEHLLHPDSKSDYDGWMNQIMNFQNKPRSSMVQHMKDGRWVEVLRYQTSDNGTIIIRADITERRRAEEDLIAAKDEAEAASVAKSRFLASASHDLRQPLQSATLFIDSLKRLDDDPKRLGIIDKSINSLSAAASILNALLDISKLDANMMEPRVEDVRLMDVITKIDDLRPLADGKGLDLRIVDTSLLGRTDPVLLETMLRNLVSNAIKYTKTGRVLLGCRPSGENIRIEVWDTGIGIPDDELRSIFEEFYQVGNEARDREQGLGLGLSIVQRMARLLEHRVNTRSDLAKGSLFSIELPRSSNTILRKPVPNAPEQCHIRRSSVVMIDDEPAVLESMEMLMESVGFKIIGCEYSGPDCQQYSDLLQRCDVEPPDVIVCDYRLPGNTTGIEVIKQMREALSSDVPALIITGDISQEVLQKIQRHEFRVLHKPVGSTELKSAIDDLLAAHD